MSGSGIRLLWAALGWTALGLGLVGVLLPVMPTTPFVILSAFAFSRGSPAVRARLERSRHFGPAIKDWEEKGAIRRRHKVMACTLMTASLVGALWLGLSAWVLLFQGSALAAAMAFVLTRPSADR